MTNGVITYNATSNGKATFTVPNYGKWTVSATINGTVISKVVDVTEAKQIPVLLGYQTMTAVINLSNSNPTTCVTYADDAVGMTAEQWDEFFGHYPVLLKDGKEVGRLDRNNYALFEDGSLADIESGKSGDVMIAFPRRGLKITKSGTTTMTISMTNDPDNPDFKYYAHQRGSVQKNVFYIGAFKGTRTVTTNFVRYRVKHQQSASPLVLQEPMPKITAAVMNNLHSISCCSDSAPMS